MFLELDPPAIGIVPDSDPSKSFRRTSLGSLSEIELELDLGIDLGINLGIDLRINLWIDLGNLLNVVLQKLCS